MSADRLREAAALLRERAEAATPGPWMVDGSQVYPTAHGAPLVAATRTHSLSDTPDAAYIALMHPEVAKAFADWLDKAGADEWAHGPHCLTPCDDCDDDPRAPHIRSALAVADEILGGDR